MGITNLHDYVARVEQAVRENLGGAQVIAMIQSQRESSEREGYWEKAYVVTWQRPVRAVNLQPSLDSDGFTYATHRVHINSADEAMCFDGHYDQSRNGALLDMCKRVNFTVPTVDAQDKIDRLHRDLELSVCYSPQAIRDSFDGADEGHPDAAWAKMASDEELLEVSESIIGSDPTWRDFRRNIELGIEEMRNRKDKDA